MKKRTLNYREKRCDGSEQVLTEYTT